MKLSKHSENHFLNTLVTYNVPRDYANYVYRYFVYAYEPGSFFHALFSNDMARAMMHSHPSNSITGLKSLMQWLVNTETRGMVWGSESVVRNWMHSTDNDRREVLESVGLIYPEHIEVVKILKEEPTNPPFFMY